MMIISDFRAPAFQLETTIAQLVEQNGFTDAVLALNSPADREIGTYLQRTGVPYRRLAYTEAQKETAADDAQLDELRAKATETIGLDVTELNQIDADVFVVAQMQPTTDGRVALDTGSMLDFVGLAFSNGKRALNVILPPELGMAEIQTTEGSTYGRRMMCVDPKDWGQDLAEEQGLTEESESGNSEGNDETRV